MNGSEIRLRRKALRFTQAELAAALGVEPNTVARWEREEVFFNEKMLRLALTGLMLERYAEADADELDLTPVLRRRVQRQISRLQDSRQTLLQLLNEK